MAIPKHRLAVAVMVLNKDDKVLLVKGPKRGWEFPGGYVGEGESIKEAAIREVKEESGIDIELTKFCGINQEVERSTCVVIFTGRTIRGELAVSDESLDVDYFTLDEAMRMITRDLYKDRILKCLNENEHPFLTEI